MRACCDQGSFSSFCSPIEPARVFFFRESSRAPSLCRGILHLACEFIRNRSCRGLRGVCSDCAVIRKRVARGPFSTPRPSVTDCLLPASSGRARDVVCAVMSSGGIAGPERDRSNPSHPAYGTSVNLRGAATPEAFDLTGAVAINLAGIAGAVTRKSWMARLRRILSMRVLDGVFGGYFCAHAV